MLQKSSTKHLFEWRHRAIFVLESNSGYLELLQLLEEAGERSKACQTLSQAIVPAVAFRGCPPLSAAACCPLDNVFTSGTCFSRAQPRAGLDRVFYCLPQVSPETAQRVLKDLMFSAWQSRGGGQAGAGGEGDGGEEEEGGVCREGRADTLKMLALVDFYLPFLPLERRHIERCAAPRFFLHGLKGGRKGLSYRG